MCMFQMFHLLQTYVAFKCFILQVFHVSEICSESHEGTAPAPRDGTRGTPEGRADGVCSSSSRLSGLARAEREERVRGKERRRAGWGETDWGGGGVRVRDETRQMGKDCSDTVGVRRISARPFGRHSGASNSYRDTILISNLVIHGGFSIHEL